MKSLKWLLVVMAVSLVPACGGAKTTVDYDREADFSKYKTYAYEKGTPVDNQLMDQRVVAALETQMKAEGFQKVASNPQVYATYHASTQGKTQFVTVPWATIWRWGRRGMPYDSPNTGEQLSLGPSKTVTRLSHGSAGGGGSPRIPSAWPCRETQMKAEGFQKVASNPQVYATYHASTQGKTQFVTDTMGYGYGAGWGRRGMGGMATSTTRQVDYTVAVSTVYWNNCRGHLGRIYQEVGLERHRFEDGPGRSVEEHEDYQRGDGEDV